MRIKPAEGLKVRIPYNPSAGYLEPEGREVPDGDLYWHRLLLDGDVVKVDGGEAGAQ